MCLNWVSSKCQFAGIGKIDFTVDKISKQVKELCMSVISILFARVIIDDWTQYSVNTNKLVN